MAKAPDAGGGLRTMLGGPRPARVAAAERPDAPLATTLITGALIVAALYLGREVFIPMALAVLLSFVLGPLVNLFRRLRLPRLAAVGLAVILTLGIILALAGVIGMQVAGLGSDVPRYRTTIERKVTDLKEGTIGRAAAYVRDMGRALRRAAEEPSKPEPAPPAARGEAPEKPTLVEVREREPTPVELAERLLSPVLQPLATLGIVLIVLVFVLAQREDLRDRMIRLFGSSDLHRTTLAMDDAARRLSRYFVTQLALNAGFGTVIGLGLWAIGVPSPLLWGVFAGLMRFVPYIGAFIAAIGPLLLATAVDPGWTMVLATLALFLVVEPVTGHGIEPMVYGQSTGLSPFAVLVAAFFWTWLWGPVGLLLATPLTVCLVVLGRHVEKLEFLDVLFGDRPALTPVENFYQRLLADDADEAQEHAEEILKSCSLSSYYDEVALKGLQLAARDATRGVLTEAQLERIRGAIRDLVEEMAERPDAPAPAPGRVSRMLGGRDFLGREPDPPPCEADPVAVPPLDPAALPPEWQGQPVLCVAGRGPLDEAASTMLAQLLGKHGLGARVVPHHAVSRGRIRSLDAGGAAMVCVINLELGGAPAHLRYLVQRLRQRVPGARLLVGLWSGEDPLPKDDKRRELVEADDFVNSLGGAVHACVDAARRAGATPPAASPEKATPRQPAPA